MARAHDGLADEQLRRNLYLATHAIRERRAQVIDELPDWEELREAGRAIKDRALRHLDVHLSEFERNFQAAGGVVHWARDALEANETVVRLVKRTGAREAIKVKSMLTEELGLNPALERAGIIPIESDLAELIVQLAGDRPSHLLVPAVHRNRFEIQAIFREHLPGCDAIGSDPAELADAARRYLRERFLTARAAISGANFAVAETGMLCVVESEGNGRMCTTLPQTLITVVGIEKMLPHFADLSVMLELLSRSATGERMNPYTSLWSGATPGDGPEDVHVVLVDAGRTSVLRDRTGRQALHCIRCSACLNVCPVFERIGGHAYGAAYQGPIGAILVPQLSELETGSSLPWASSLCGACYDVCPVKIDIPRVLVHLRGRVVRERRVPRSERLAMRVAARALRAPWLYALAQVSLAVILRWLARYRVVRSALPPLARWHLERELPEAPRRGFRASWRSRG